MHRTTRKTLYWIVQIAGIFTLASVVVSTFEHASRHTGSVLTHPETWAFGLPFGALLLFAARSLHRKIADSDPVPSPARIVVFSLLHGVIGVPILGHFVTILLHGRWMSEATFGMTMLIGLMTSLALIVMRLLKRQNSLAGARSGITAGDEGQDAA